MPFKPRSQWPLVFAALAMLVLSVVIVLDRSAQRMGLLDKVFAWLAAGAALLLTVAAIRAWRS